MVKLRSQVRCLMEGGAYSDLSVNDGALIIGCAHLRPAVCCLLYLFTGQRRI